ncbi:hypothetical protein CR105_27040 [Massilia eurypsychrophila]|uniref:Uncharacterized protein n=1 Tax=Massilia eurypsychrophila TaxID=1485217 RepID=A0A2G8T7F6_9BURK|nr:hypothetical protein [Massilia eurypsychrophila]PIL41934.1 hypothetical protein CR105_27040 [Massilia eurypsychrophila]
MSLLTNVTSAAVSGIWKAAAIGILVASVASSAYLGYNWHMAALDRDQARTELAVERTISAQYQLAIREQNRAVESLAKQKAEAEARGQAAQQIAAANGRRFDGALERIKGAKATTCDEAMPAVNAILEAIK